MKRTGKKTGIGELWSRVGRYRPLYFIALAASLLGAAAGAAGNLLIRKTVDDVILAHAGIGLLSLFASAYLATVLIKALMAFFTGRGTAATSEGITRDLRNQLYDHLQRLSFRYHDKMQTGELVQRSTSDVDAVRRFYQEQIPQILRITFLFLINFGAIMLLNVRLAFLSILTIPLSLGLSLFFFKRISKKYSDYQDQEGHVTALIQENLNGIRVVRAFARQDWEEEKFEKQNRAQLVKGRSLMFWEAAYWPGSHIICGAQFLFVVTIGGIMAIQGEITPGVFIAFTAMVEQIIWPLRELGRMISELSKSTVSFKRITEILKEGQEEEDDTDKPVCEHLRGNLEFRQVSFSYEKNTPVLNAVNLQVCQGEKIAIIGETGSGKTTLVNLLPRFYDLTAGSIKIDDRDIRDIRRHDLRRNIGLVEQDPFLFSMSIRANIALGVEREVDDEEIIAAARAAAVHDSIIGFPDGYDTIVGERGVSLSGGQKQRIAIARTLLKNPEILILDDATSAVDAETEASINKALKKLKEGRTTFIIAHKVQSLRYADRIIVLKEGRIIQEGRHEELIAHSGFYRQVFDLQTQIEEELEEDLKNA